MNRLPQQKRAADPSRSIIASANAGSGKTLVLVDRVSRILLQKTDPEKILCLTYTKAAASEMQSRLFKTLGEWSILPEDELRDQLNDILPEGHGFTDLPLARTLFAKALETPEGLKVQTIHAFCERILSRFPIEAGILPGFEPLDDADQRALKDSVRADLYRAAAAEPDGDLNAALQDLAAAKADKTLDGLFKWTANSPEKLRRWKALGLDALADLMGIKATDTVQSIKQAAWNAAPREALKAAAEGLEGSGNAKENRYSKLIYAALSEVDPVEAFDLYAQAVLKSDLSPFSQIGTAKSGDAARHLFGAWNKTNTPEMHRMAEAGQKILSVDTLALTRSLLILSADYSARYEHAKRVRRGLDFTDQIILVRNLLMNTSVSEWVRYKLDGGIEHILVDEAQDTAPEQWEIIDTLSEEFTQDYQAERKKQPRTLFAVGDEKQSIYSFQGARPEQFQNKVNDVLMVTEHGKIDLEMSFRSTPEVLAVVDQLFDKKDGRLRMFDAENYHPANDPVRHIAFRSDSGQVDLWPPVEKPEKGDDKEPWDTTPVDAMSKADAREQLAVAIAETIKSWIDYGELVFDRELKETRPMKAGDILILVRQRKQFFNAVIRNLKACRVPVAGADRLVLKDAIAVKDLLSLARFVLLPSDDLSLAEVLKGPLFNYSEEDLFAVAAGRIGQTLWQSVRVKRPDDGALLSDIKNYAGQFPPYEFFARVLDMTDAKGESFMRKMFLRLGLEAKDAIDAFHARALEHQRRGSPSLQHFVQAFAKDDVELKREMDTGAGQVRVMTVHGAKGLEAPVVFMPDTTQEPKMRGDIIPVEDGFALPPSSAQTPAVLKTYKDRVLARDKQEYMRLLYVAMTRAESRLVICGYNHGRGVGKVGDSSWYKEVESAFAGLETRPIDTPFGEGRAYGAGAEKPINAASETALEAANMPGWIRRPAPPEAPMRRRVTPSHLLHSGTDMPVRSPLSQDPQTRFQRGNLIHKLLELLPDMPAEKRRDAAKSILGGYDGINADDILREVFAVLDNPDFAEIFAPGSRAEISLAGTAKGLPPHLYLNAQIDRISVTPERVFIVDYKSNRPPPISQEGVADLYWGQMAAYRALAQEIYPGREVICALLWTDGPHLMILDEKRLDVALTQIAALPT